MRLSVVARSTAVALSSVAVVTTVTGAAMGLSDQAGPEILLVGVAVLALATVGTLLAIRIPGNAIGWLLLVTALCLGVWFLGTAYVNLSMNVAAGTLPGTAEAAWLYVLFGPITALNLAIPLIFPDGRLLSPRWRWLIALLVYSAVTGFAQDAFRPGPMPYSGIENPFGIAGIEGILPPTGVVGVVAGVILAAVLFLGAIASVVIRYRRGSLVERQQLKWLIAAVALNVTAWPIVAVSGSLGLTVIYTIGAGMGILAFSALPIAIGIAILRYRLYEIDRIISRTLAWALVTGVLATVFVGTVVVLQELLAGLTQRQTLAVAGSTIVAFALFQPLRRRVQQAIDRRFDRSRYDADNVVVGLGERLSHMVDLDALLAEIGSVVRESVRPTSSTVWLRAGTRRPGAHGS